MSSLIEFLIAFIIILIIGGIIFSLGTKGAKKEDERPYASGEKYPSIKISYRTIKLFYAALFGVIDAAAILLAFLGGASLSLSFIGYWALILFSLLVLVKLRREIK